MLPVKLNIHREHEVRRKYRFFKPDQISSNAHRSTLKPEWAAACAVKICPLGNERQLGAT